MVLRKTRLLRCSWIRSWRFFRQKWQLELNQLKRLNISRNIESQTSGIRSAHLSSFSSSAHVHLRIYNNSSKIFWLLCLNIKFHICRACNLYNILWVRQIYSFFMWDKAIHRTSMVRWKSTQHLRLSVSSQHDCKFKNPLATLYASLLVK